MENSHFVNHKCLINLLIIKFEQPEAKMTRLNLLYAAK
jgi:hypothetical protein